MGMVTRDIRCRRCGHTGKIEAHDTPGDTPKDRLFTFEGKDSGGYLRFRCPNCKTDVAVDPVWATPSPEMQGADPGRAQKGYVPDVAGCVAPLALGVFLLFVCVRGCGDSPAPAPVDPRFRKSPAAVTPGAPADQASVPAPHPPADGQVIESFREKA